MEWDGSSPNYFRIAVNAIIIPHIIVSLTIKGLNIKTLLYTLIDICFLRAGPQILPASRLLYHLSLLLFIGSEVLVNAAFAPVGLAFAHACAELVLLLLLLQLSLRFANRSARYIQTVTAICGTGCVLNILLRTLITLAHINQSSNELAQILYFLIAGVLLWSLFVNGHILRHTFEVRLAVGILIALAYAFAITGLILLLAHLAAGF